MSRQPIRIGARGSKLSLAQSGLMQARIATALGWAPGEEIDAFAQLIPIVTSGDRIQDRRLMEIGGKGLFTKEIEEALLDGRIDCAVHSLKDMPAELPPGLVLAATPEREDPRDAFISHVAERLEDLPKGARLGTASLRRQAQALHVRPDLQIVMLRGNVDTRLAKLERGEADAILLAQSGLNRLSLGHLTRSWLDPLAAPPAPGQGALVIETRAEDVDLPWLQAVRCQATTLAVAAERGALYALEGSCRTAVGAHARLDGLALTMIVEALTPHGAQRFRREGSITLSSPDAADEARALGLELGAAVRAEGGPALILTD
ncbi:hydroxymethylbilane synthase [Caulobacter sp. BE254]|uniref:hydroxymethylbilane synthase n=1 Tax=Caulobacter sp. BE254 TaxID=2817720 RepID=UPI002860C153|nr:hydroxymethylbilane synthase [Caulobacter sp. BE254]MDR7115065.1 hydroxymethylbilane synthase [Caulobacter sp. BE254]